MNAHSRSGALKSSKCLRIELGKFERRECQPAMFQRSANLISPTVYGQKMVVLACIQALRHQDFPAGEQGGRRT